MGIRSFGLPRRAPFLRFRELVSVTSRLTSPAAAGAGWLFGMKRFVK